MDEEWKNLLVEHLGVLGDRVRTWNDRDIRTGDDWKAEIERELNAASVAVLLVSVDFLNSRFVRREEIPVLLRRREQQGLRIVPVILRPCAWRSVDWLERMQVRPRGARALLMHDKGRVAIEDEFASLAEDIADWLQRAPATSTGDTASQEAMGRSGAKPDAPRQPAAAGPPVYPPAHKTAAPVHWEQETAPVEPPVEPASVARSVPPPLSEPPSARPATPPAPAQFPNPPASVVETNWQGSAPVATVPIAASPQAEGPASSPASVKRTAQARPSGEPAIRPTRSPSHEPRPRAQVPAVGGLSARRQWLLVLGLVLALAAAWGLRARLQPVPSPSIPSPPAWPAFQTVVLDSAGAVRDRRYGTASYFREDLGGGVSLDMVRLPGGPFTMGSPSSEAQRDDDEGPQHEVRIAPFALGRFEVTQAQWRAVAAWPQVKIVLNSDPAYFKGADRPVEQVTWHEAVEFCARLSRRLGKTYRLPSEAEWEYAARAGTTTPFAFGETITPEIVNYNGNYPYAGAAEGAYRASTTNVGALGVANAFGLFDLHGNVWEWVRDVWHPTYVGAPSDGRAWEQDGDTTLRVLRGGSWYNLARHCRSAFRHWYAPDGRDRIIGVRVVCEVART